MQFYHIQPKRFAKEIAHFFGGEGEDYKTFKIHLIKDIFVNIHHTPCAWENY